MPTYQSEAKILVKSFEAHGGVPPCSEVTGLHRDLRSNSQPPEERIQIA
jgi:hypothetical protein